ALRSYPHALPLAQGSPPLSRTRTPSKSAARSDISAGPATFLRRAQSRPDPVCLPSAPSFGLVYPHSDPDTPSPQLGPLCYGPQFLSLSIWFPSLVHNPSPVLSLKSRSRYSRGIRNNIPALTLPRSATLATLCVPARLPLHLARCGHGRQPRFLLRSLFQESPRKSTASQLQRRRSPRTRPGNSRRSRNALRDQAQRINPYRTASRSTRSSSRS